MTEIENLKADMAKLQERIDALAKKETTFEVGKWYKLTEDYGSALKKGDVYQFIEYQRGSHEWITLDHVAFGIRDKNCYSPHKSILIPATDKEVSEALIKEAERRGFKEGVIVKNNGLSDSTPENIIHNKPDFRLQKTDMTLWVSTRNYYGICIFKDGIWAEILKEEPIEIGGYEVVFYGDKSKGDMLYTKIDGNDFLKHFWEAAKIISEHSKAKIMVGCSKQFDVSLETINKILSKL